MHKRYGYRKVDIIFPYSLLLPIPMVLAYVLLKFSHINEEPLDAFLIGAYVLAWVLCLATLVPIVVWIMNNIKVVIVLSDVGISKKDMFREVLFKWNEIAKIEKKYLYEGSYVSYQGAPSDLLIYNADGKKMQVFKRLHSLDGTGEGIAEFEKELYQHIDLDKLPDTKKSQKNQLRLGIAAGCFVIIAAFVVGYRAPHKTSGLLGLLINSLGIRGTVITIILLGCIIIAAFVHRFKKLSK